MSTPTARPALGIAPTQVVHALPVLCAHLEERLHAELTVRWIEGAWHAILTWDTIIVDETVGWELFATGSTPEIALAQLEHDVAADVG